MCRLGQAIAEGRFREDLFYRLNVLTLPVPPLRDRPEDIAPLAYHFLRLAERDFNRPVEGFAADAMAALQPLPLARQRPGTDVGGPPRRGRRRRPADRGRQR